MAVNETEVARLMKLTNSTREEDRDMLECDKRIDRGEKLFELTDEQKKVAKKMSNFDSKNRKKPMVLDLKQPKNRKENATKGGIIAELVTFFSENSQFSVENLEILNKERQFTFKIGDETYEITLIQKRKPKK